MARSNRHQHIDLWLSVKYPLRGSHDSCACLFYTSLSLTGLSHYIPKSMQHCSTQQAVCKTLPRISQCRDSVGTPPRFSWAELFVSSTTKSYWLKLVTDLKWGPVGSLAAEMAVYWITGLIWFWGTSVHYNDGPPGERSSLPDSWTLLPLQPNGENTHL